MSSHQIGLGLIVLAVVLSILARMTIKATMAYDEREPGNMTGGLGFLGGLALAFAAFICIYAGLSELLG